MFDTFLQPGSEVTANIVFWQQNKSTRKIRNPKKERKGGSVLFKIKVHN